MMSNNSHPLQNYLFPKIGSKKVQLLSHMTRLAVEVAGLLVQLQLWKVWLSFLDRIHSYRNIQSSNLLIVILIIMAVRGDGCMRDSSILVSMGFSKRMIIDCLTETKIDVKLIKINLTSSLYLDKLDMLKMMEEQTKKLKKWLQDNPYLLE